MTFDPVTVSSKNCSGTVRLGDDALAADNAFNFVVSPSEPVRLIVVDRGERATLLSHARAVDRRGAAVRDRRRASRTRSPTTICGAARSSCCNDVAVSAGLARRLAQFVEQGGGLFVAAGPRATWPQDVDLLPATIGNPVDRTRGDAGAHRRARVRASGVRAVPRARAAATSSSVPVYGYRNVTAAKDAQVLARFDAGAPAVVERRVGNGRVLLWASTLDVSWSDLPLKPVFLPFVHAPCGIWPATREPQPWLTVGQVLDPRRWHRAAASTHARRADAVGPPGADRGRGRRMCSSWRRRGSTSCAATATQRTSRVVAGNVDPAEADLTPMDPKEIVAARRSAAHRR